VRHLDGKKGELEQLNLMRPCDIELGASRVHGSISTKDKCDGFCVTTLAAAFGALCKRAMFLNGEPYKTVLLLA